MGRPVWKVVNAHPWLRSESPFLLGLSRSSSLIGHLGWRAGQSGVSGEKSLLGGLGSWRSGPGQQPSKVGALAWILVQALLLSVWDSHLSGPQFSQL